MVRHVFPQTPVLRLACDEPFQALGVTLIEEAVEPEIVTQLIPPADGEPVLFRVQVFPGGVKFGEPVAAKSVLIVQGLVDEGQSPVSPLSAPTA